MIAKKQKEFIATAHEIATKAASLMVAAYVASTTADIADLIIASTCLVN
jgi:hypothetical protein